MIARVLVVDDDDSHRLSLCRALSLSCPELEISNCASLAELSAFDLAHFDVVVLDLILERSGGAEIGLHLIPKLLSRAPCSRVIVLTGCSCDDFGIAALKLGAANFIQKPVNLEHLLALIRDGATQARMRREYLSVGNTVTQGDFIGSSAAIREVQKQIAFAASTSLPVLILGETGTGKGVIARLIHKLSGERSGAPFVRYQPTGTSSEMIAGELFGHRRGAFTGAISDNPGIFNRVKNGTLFLDEIDEFPHPVQVALLGVMQEGMVRKLGCTDESQIVFRVVSASNRGIDELNSGKLREDLYHRLAQIQISIPPLRSRRKDIPELIKHFLDEVKAEISRPDLIFSDRDYEMAMGFDWPGNVRQLRNLVRRSVFSSVHHGASHVTLDLPIEQSRQLSGQIKSVSSAAVASSVGAPQISYPDRLEDGPSMKVAIERYAREIVNSVLQKTGGNVSVAAKILKVDRSTIRRYR